MAYIKSNNISVFPSALRAAENGNYASGKYTSEPNLTGIIKTIADRDSFIIRWDIDEENTENNIAEFVINGYYFRISGVDLPTPTGGDSNLYASIRLDSADRLCRADDSGYTYLDDNSNFIGVVFGGSEINDTSDTTAYNLKIYENNSLFADNFHKFNAERIFFVIDGANLDLQPLLESLNNSGLSNGGALSPTRGGTGMTTATYTNAVVIGNSGTATGAMQTVQTKRGAFFATRENDKPQFDTLPVAEGGTGVTTITSDRVLVGNGTGAIGTIQKTSDNTANTLVQRGESGNFSAGTITANLDGTAATATNATNDSEGNEISSTYLKLEGGKMSGAVTDGTYDIYRTGQVRNITISNDDASGGINGDIWITYSN